MFHRFGVRCLAWDLQHPHLLERSLAMGMDGVFSDWVDRMVDALALAGRDTR
jgi:glycerophosphoryl diester phosphodiesterase